MIERRRRMRLLVETLQTSGAGQRRLGQNLHRHIAPEAGCLAEAASRFRRIIVGRVGPPVRTGEQLTPIRIDVERLVVERHALGFDLELLRVTVAVPVHGDRGPDGNRVLGQAGALRLRR
jgi:hypothetical protein